MGKGNISIDKSMVKTVVDGKIIIPLPKVLVENRYYQAVSKLKQILQLDNSIAKFINFFQN
jgi:hypothetical protein